MDAERDEREYDEEEHDGGSDVADKGAWDLAGHDTYWRRRFLILCAGVVALGVCAWLLPGARQARGTSAAARESMAAAATRQSLPPAAYGPAWSSAAPSPGPSPAGYARLAGKTRKPRKAGASHRPRRAGSPVASTSASAAGGKAAACAPAGLVLSLFTSQAGYGKKTRPRFSVYAVSTAAAGCTLTFGSGAVRVIVTDHGRVVWNSAACGPPAAKPVRFTLGVPQLLTVTWNRGAAGPAGCAGFLPAGFTGTLRAVAMSHGQSSPVRTFKLTR